MCVDGRLTARPSARTARAFEQGQLGAIDETLHMDVDVIAPRTASGAGTFERQDKKPKTMSIDAATALKAASRKATSIEDAETRGGSKVWGPTGHQGITPEDFLAHMRNKLTHSWGPKPQSIVRPCRMREGDVTKRIRMDRDRLVKEHGGASSPTQATPGTAAYFKPIPLAMIQTNKHLVGLPLQRTYPGTRSLSTDPFAGMGAAHAMGRWAQREIKHQVGGGGPGLYWQEN
jgi:hypothetical protein